MAALEQDASVPAWTFPVKLLGRRGSEGTLTIDANAVVYSTPAKDSLAHVAL